MTDEKDSRGPRAIDRVLATGKKPSRSTVVPEWDDLEVFTDGRITPQDRYEVNKRIEAAYDDWPPGGVADVYMLVQKLTDENGDPLFDWDDVTRLVRDGDTAIFDRLTLWLYGEDRLKSLAEAKKG